MTQKEFIEILKKEKYSYEIQGDKIIVTHKVTVYLSFLTSLPPGVEFKNKGAVSLYALTSLPPGVEFKNEWYVDLRGLTSIPPDVVFRNEGDVYLDYLTSIPSGVVFRNGGDVNLESLIGGWLFKWKGNIEGIDSNRLLNSMISKEMFI
jgi:hypothetical protein